MNEYQIAAIAGLSIFAFWHLAYVLSWIVQWAWSWVDDSKMGKYNYIIRKIAYQRGYGHKDEFFTWNYYHKDNGDGTDGGGPFYLIVMITSFIPLALILSIDFYPVVLAILTLVLIAHVARFSRRHKKIFDDHVKDKSAHK